MRYHRGPRCSARNPASASTSRAGFWHCNIFSTDGPRRSNGGPFEPQAWPRRDARAWGRDLHRRLWCTLWFAGTRSHACPWRSYARRGTGSPGGRCPSPQSSRLWCLGVTESLGGRSVRGGLGRGDASLPRKAVRWGLRSDVEGPKGRWPFPAIVPVVRPRGGEGSAREEASGTDGSRDGGRGKSQPRATLGGARASLLGQSLRGLGTWMAGTVLHLDEPSVRPNRGNGHTVLGSRPGTAGSREWRSEASPPQSRRGSCSPDRTDRSRASRATAGAEGLAGS